MARQTDPDRLIVVGVLSGAHGVRGDVRVKSFTDDPDALFELGPLLSDSGEILAPRQKEEWDALKGAQLHVKRSSLPPPDADEFYVEDLVGLEAFDEEGRKVGAVKAVQDFGAGDLLEIMPDAGPAKTYFVPFTLEDVPEVDFQTGRVTLQAPDVWADQSGAPEDEDI